jgi:hypothetical protein
MSKLKQLQEQDVSSFTLALPLELRDNLFRRARSEDRSAAAIARLALKSYLGSPPRTREDDA